jgi:hypothetical protein
MVAGHPALQVSTRRHRNLRCLGENVVVVTEPEEDALKRAYVDALVELDVAFRDLRAELTQGVETIALIRRHLDRGGSVAELLQSGEIQSVRRNIGAGLKGVERARHTRDRLLFRCLDAEGFSAAEIARSFGLSRGLVSRLLNEPD